MPVDASVTLDATGVMDATTPTDAPMPGDVSDVTVTDVSPDRPAAPNVTRLIAPLSGARVTHRQPTLRWSLPAGFTRARVEVCADRACTRVEAYWGGVGTRWRLNTDLSEGVHFWRVFGVGVGAPNEVLSEVWSFVVPPRSGVVDTSWNALTDFNGDGRSDVLSVTHDGMSEATWRAHYGRAEWLPLWGDALTSTGSPILTAVGDLDGDGYGDLALRTVCVEDGADRVAIHRGGPGGFSPTASHEIVWRGAGCEAGLPVVGVGDVNGDGYGDLLVMSPERARGLGGFGSRVELHLGAPVGQPMVASTVIEGGSEYNGFGEPSALGDVNGDGYADVATRYRPGTIRGNGVIPGEVRIHFGGPMGLSAQPSVRLFAPDPNDLGYGMLPSGPLDTDGDGYADVLVSNHWGPAPIMGQPAWQLWVHHGASTWSPLPVGESLNPMPLVGNLAGSMTVAAGDYNHDGRSDLAVLASQRGSVLVQLYRGGDGATATRFAIADRVLNGPRAARGADMNGDGREDLFVSLGLPGAGEPTTGCVVDVFWGGVWPLSQNSRTWLAGAGRPGLGCPVAW